MNYKKIMLASIILLAILTIGAVSAEDDVLTAEEDSGDVIDTPVDDVELMGDSQYIEDEGDYYSIEMPKELLSNDNIKFGVTENAYGEMKISVDGEEKFSQSYTGYEYIEVYDWGLTYGSHKANFYFSGDEEYEGFSKNFDFNYVYLKCNIPKEATTDDSLRIDVADGVEGYYKVLIDNKQVFDDEYAPNIGLSDLSFGQHTYEVRYYNGNEKSLTKKGTFTLSYPFDVSVNDDTLYMGDELAISIKLPNDVTSNAVITCNGKSYDVDLISGVGYYCLSDFSLGENEIQIKYEDNKHPKKIVTQLVNVLARADCPTEIGYMDNSNITLILPSTAQGTLNVRINGKTYTENLQKGKAVVSLNNLTVGYYDDVEITYSGDFEDKVSWDVYSITVKPYLKVPYKMYVNGNYEVFFNAPDDFNGLLSIPELGVETEIKNGKATTTITIIPQGENWVSATVTKDDVEYYYYFEVIGFTVSPDWEMKVDFTSEVNKARNYEDFGPVIRVNSPDDVDESVFTVYIDGMRYGVMYSYDEFEVTSFVKSLPEGKHYFTVVYDGNYFKSQNKTVYFDVGYVTSYIPSTIILSQDDVASVTVPLDATGTVTFYVDGKKEYSEKIVIDDDFDSYYNVYTVSYDLSVLSFKTHEIEVVYNGNYGEVSKKVTVDMDYEINLGLEGYQFVYGLDDTFTFSVPLSLTQRVDVFLDGVKQDYRYDDGMNEYVVNISKVGLGEHSVSVVYPGDSKVPSKTFTENFTTVARITGDGSIDCGEVGYISLVLPKDATGTLFIWRYNGDNGEYVKCGSAQMTDGVAKFQKPNIDVGYYNFLASFEGSYQIENETISYDVIPRISCPDEMTVGENKQLNVELGPNQKGTLTIEVDYETYIHADIVGGKASVSLSKLAIGYHDILIGYNVDDGEVSGESYKMITVKGYTPKLVGGKNINMYYCDGNTYGLKVWGVYGKVVGAGEIVKIKIGSKTYKAKTNKKGIATLKITDLPGKYTITATYNGVKVTNKLTVKRVISLKAVKVKKSAKKLVLTATLKKGKSPIKSKTVVFKFNGKTFKAKTNKKGIAKVTIKKSILKKLKVGKKITYQATYLKDTVKKSVKVKK